MSIKFKQNVVVLLCKHGKELTRSPHDSPLSREINIDGEWYEFVRDAEGPAVPARTSQASPFLEPATTQFLLYYKSSSCPEHDDKEKLD